MDPDISFILSLTQQQFKQLKRAIKLFASHGISTENALTILRESHYRRIAARNYSHAA